MSWLAPPTYGSSLSTGSSRPLQPGDRDYCLRCAQNGHDRRACPDRPHASGQQGAACPHPRQSSGSTIGPGDSASLAGYSPQGAPDYSFSALLGSQHHSSNTPGLKTWQDVRAQPGFESVTEQEAQRLAERYNLLLQRATREATAKRLRDLGLNPDDILDPLPPSVPATGAPAPNFPGFTGTPAPGTPVAPGSTQVVPFGGTPTAPTARIAHNVEIGHINIATTHATFAMVHRATYDPATIQTALTAAASGTFVNLAYLSLRWTFPTVTWGWRVQIRIVQAATLPAAPANFNAFTALGGNLIERDSTQTNATGGVTTITFTPPSNLAVPLHVFACVALGSGTNATTAFGYIGIEVGANVS